MTADAAGTRIALMCRAGFEDDLYEEIGSWMAAHAGAASLGWKEPGMLLVELTSASDSRPPLPGYADLIFARDLMLVRAELSGLDTRDRFGPIEQAIEKLGPLRSVSVLTADSDAGKPLAPLVRGLEGRVGGRLVEGKASARSADPQKQAHAQVWLVSGTHALVGTTLPGPGALFPGGIPRLRFPREAPSRSTLKLDEAFCVLLTEGERNHLVKAGMRAVDLGAAPGGWTYQLVRRHIRVIAVDNGRMDATLLATGLVEHLREDGFRYTPARPVDWLVCDMVEKPARVVDLVLRWFKGGHCRAAIFNLKLPMKKRFAAWQQAREAFAPLAARGLELRARQLYHDREEITVALLPVGKVKPSQTPTPKAKVQNRPDGRIHRRRP